MAKKKQYDKGRAIIIYPIAPIEGLLYGDEFDDIEVALKISYYNPITKEIEGMSPFIPDDLGMGNAIKEAVRTKTLSSAIRQARLMGASTIIIIRPNEEEQKKKIKEFVAMSTVDVDPAEILARHQQTINTLRRMFRIIEISADIVADIMRRNIEGHDKELGDALFSNNIEDIQEALAKIMTIKINLKEIDKQYWKLLPNTATNLMVAAATKKKPLEEYMNVMIKYSIITLIIFVLSWYVFPNFVAPLVYKYLPSFGVKMVQKTITDIKVPIFDEIKGMYLPPGR